jgi:hypothetical protein
MRTEYGMPFHARKPRQSELTDGPEFGGILGGKQPGIDQGSDQLYSPLSVKYTFADICPQYQIVK